MNRITKNNNGFYLMNFKLILIFSVCLVVHSVMLFNKSNATDNTQRVYHLTEVETKDLLNKNNKLIIIDLRTPKEFEESHIKGAININVFSKDFEERIIALVKDYGTTTPWLVYCRTGNRSLKAIPDLMRLFSGTIYHIKDGVAYSSIPLESGLK